ncbi:MAG: methyltransferase domain-containing protein [Candidatus Diapherotrites archaeon]|jgi:hypothetical protein|uniref:Methyltransferase domain-containing protein n=1 Tax=Candidatus Iainarchaeum sp. TaxID=3101447 RepID=A0A8T5GF28_9ARCH|nr:methyltransferase domain-containing protein [Candidatus Diapherotrites archaeon]MBT7241650.1 methyltransferase domain-containing protein [Candidatus Diapherotrites archaeon]
MHENSMKLMRNFVNNNLDKSKKLSILDVGSYDINGSYKELFDWPWDYTGLDLEAGKNVDFVAKSLYDWGLDKKFDVVISGQTLEHVKDTHKWILEVKKHVKKNGLICIIAP